MTTRRLKKRHLKSHFTMDLPLRGSVFETWLHTIPKECEADFAAYVRQCVVLNAPAACFECHSPCLGGDLRHALHFHPGKLICKRCWQYDEHRKWPATRVAEPGLCSGIVRQDGVAIGTVRDYDHLRRCGEVSLHGQQTVCGTLPKTYMVSNREYK